jgi:hypothetical protein
VWMGVVGGGGNLARGRAAKLRDPVRRYCSILQRVWRCTFIVHVQLIAKK